MNIPHNIILAQENGTVTLTVDYGTQTITQEYRLRRVEPGDGVMVFNSGAPAPLLLHDGDRVALWDSLREWEHVQQSENTALRAQLAQLEQAVAALRSENEMLRRNTH